MSELKFSLNRSVLICARRETVFRFFTDSELFAQWWGPGSTIEGRPGGAMKIIHPNNEKAFGTVLEMEKDKRIVFSFGYDNPAMPVSPEDSRVTVTLEERPGGTLLTLKHDLASEKVRDHHVQGWRFQLALFSNVATRVQNTNLTAVLDRYFSLWGEADGATRLAGLREVATPDIVFQDQYSFTTGVEDLDAHLNAARTYMPGVTLTREGNPRLTHGVALSEWMAKSGDGKVIARGTNAFLLAPDGKLARVVGFWAG